MNSGLENKKVYLLVIVKTGTGNCAAVTTLAQILSPWTGIFAEGTTMALLPGGYKSCKIRRN